MIRALKAPKKLFRLANRILALLSDQGLKRYPSRTPSSRRHSAYLLYIENPALSSRIRGVQGAILVLSKIPCHVPKVIPVSNWDCIFVP